jgi:glycosyltransferase involved in cell wall biosynthesis
MLSIVIPYYKLTFFEETLKSLSDQTDKRFKVYIGDDASPENPLILLEKYKDNFDFEYHRFETNLGGISLVQQWERCIDLIEKEEWIMILGDDDFLEERVVESWYKHYSVFNKKSNVIRFATKFVNMQLNATVSDSFTHPVWEEAPKSYYRRFKGLTRSALSEYIFSKQSFMKYKFHDFPLAWHSDDAAWLCFSDGKPIYTINVNNVFIRISDISISGKKDNQCLKNIASEQFYKNIVLQNISFFKRAQRLDLLMAYEMAIKKNRRLKLKEWFYLIELYFFNFKFVPFLKCLRRFLISISTK